MLNNILFLLSYPCLMVWPGEQALPKFFEKQDWYANAFETFQTYHEQKCFVKRVLFVGK